MRAADKNHFTLNMGIEPYAQSYVFSVDGSAGAVLPDVVVTHQPYKGNAEVRPAPQTTRMQFDGKAYVAKNPTVLENMPDAAHASLSGYVAGVAEGATITKVALDKGEVYSQGNLLPTRRNDWVPTGNCTSIDNPINGHWEIHGMVTRGKPTHLEARIIGPSGLAIDMQMDSDGKPHCSANTQAHQVTMPLVVQHAAYAMISGQGAGVIHALDNQIARGNQQQKNSANKADPKRSGEKRVVIDDASRQKALERALKNSPVRTKAELVKDERENSEAEQGRAR